MITARAFVDMLSEKDLVSPDLVASLRKQLAQSTTPVTAAMVARGLVEKGHLSRLLAQRLLNRADELSESDPARIRERLGLPRKTLAEEKAEEDQLGLAPLDEEEERKEKKREASPEEEVDIHTSVGEDWELAPLDDPFSQEAAEPPVLEPLRGPDPSKLAPTPPVPSPPEPPPVVPSAPSGPLDDVFQDLGVGRPPTAPAIPVGAPRRRTWSPLGRRVGRAARKRENIWDSPLLLIGGGALLILVLLLAFFLWGLNRRGAEDILALADQDYRAGNYTQAIAKYDEFVQNYPGHQSAGAARVRRGLARMRQATDRTDDWPRAQDVAEEELRRISGEEAFKTEAQNELLAMLPQIAEGLSQQACSSLDQKLVDRSHKATALADRHIPYSARPVDRLNKIEAALALAQREIVRGRRLAEAVVGINASAEKKDFAAAYTIRRALLKDYPALANDAGLGEAIRAAAAAEISVIRPIDVNRPAETGRAPAETAGTVLARRTVIAQSPDAAGRVVCALADGAAYGLDAATGQLLWRQVVGFDVNGRTPGFAPAPVSEKHGSDLLLVDRQGRQVLRVEATTGQLRWRHAIGEPFGADPVIDGERLLVATRAQRLVFIDLESGASPLVVELPQELRVAPAVDRRRSNIYQIGEHSNLYVLGREDGKAKQVVYLGHEPGSVIVPPLVIDPYLVLIVNDGVERSTLKILALDAAGKEPPLRLIGETPVEGRVNTMPAVSGARFLLTTDRGDVQIFEVTVTAGRKPVSSIASTKIEIERGLDRGQQMVRFPLMAGGQAWIADDQLTRYDVLASRGRLEPRSIQHEGGVTLQPLVAAGQSIIHVRSKVGLPGVLVTAVSAEDAKPLWETHLAAPLATEPIVDASQKRITAVTCAGVIFQFDAGSLKPGSTMDQPIAGLPIDQVRQAMTDVVALPGGVLAMATAVGLREVFVFDPAHKPEPIFRLELADPPACAPAAFANGLLVPSAAGQVQLLDPRSGALLAEPFQPRLTAAGPTVWREPLVIGDKEVLLSDGASRLYRVGIQDQPKPHLAELASQELQRPIASPLAVFGAVAYAVDVAGNLVSFGLPDLSPGEPRPLAARCVWGPRRVGDYVLAATDDQVLHVIGGEGKVRSDRLAYGPLAGTPVSVGGLLVLTSTEGVVWRIDPATGKELGKRETGLRLGTGPVPIGNKLLVAGHDGMLYLVEEP